MGGIYQLTFFLALGLLAIVVTIFVFAVSLLGRAVEAASREQEEATREQKSANEKEIRKIQKQITALMEKEHIGGELKGLEKKLNQLRKQDKKFEKKLARIGRAPELLTAKGGVAHPSIFLGIALALSGVAWYLSSINISTVPLITWGLGLAAIGYSIYRIYCSLKMVENVAITSEEAALKRTIEAFKIAQKELEEEKKPQLELTFRDTQPPFNAYAESEMAIRFAVNLSRGDIARNPAVVFFAPSGFEFIDSPKGPYPGKGYTGYLTSKFELEEVLRPIGKLGTLKLKVPSQPKHYTLFYRLYCEGFDSGKIEFDLITEEPPDF